MFYRRTTTTFDGINDLGILLILFAEASAVSVYCLQRFASLR
ncbi:MAG: hypothetical protein ACTS4W_00450 [Candidatus Hodgkinia cicadicola]